MSGYVFHPEAFADLDEIWEYIAEDNPEAADRVIEDIREAIRSLVQNPHKGHWRSGRRNPRTLSSLIRARI